MIACPVLGGLHHDYRLVPSPHKSKDICALHLFAEILYHRDATNSYWEVRSKDVLTSLYGTRASLGTDPAALADPSDRTNIFAWKLIRTEDLFGNRIVYEYERDTAEKGPHHWEQLYLKRIRYVDYEESGQITFLVSATSSTRSAQIPSPNTGPDLKSAPEGGARAS